MRLGGRRRAEAVIELTCAAEDKGVIAEPVPARRSLPDWFRSLPGIDGDELSATNNGITVKRCLPFADALAVGWIIPLAATVRLEISDGGKNVTAGSDLASAAVVRAETSEEHDLRQSIKRNALAGEGWYRRAARSARKGHALRTMAHASPARNAARRTVPP